MLCSMQSEGYTVHGLMKTASLGWYSAHNVEYIQPMCLIRTGSSEVCIFFGFTQQFLCKHIDIFTYLSVEMSA